MLPLEHYQKNETRRLKALFDTGLMDSPPEEAFDRITRLASRVLATPVALVSLVTEQRHFLKSAVGFAEPWASKREIPLSHSFCQYAVRTGEPLIINDARAHPFLRDNPAIEDMAIVAYAGMPLKNKDDLTVGVFCVVDHVPREWSVESQSILREFADLAAAAIEMKVAAVSQVRAVQSSHDVEEKFKAFMDKSPAVTYMKDSDGRLLYTNETTYRYYPEAREWLGRNSEELFPPNISAQLRANDNAAISSANGIEFEEAVPNAAGDVHHWISFKFPVRQRDGRTFLGGMSINIDDRKRTETALRESEDRFRQLVAGVREYAIFMLDTSGVVITWNEGAQRFKGYRSEEIIGKPFDIFYSPEDRQAGKPKNALLKASREGVACDVGWRIRKDGSRFYANVTITALRDANGLLRGYAKFTRDITQETELAQAREAAERKVRAIYDSAFQFIGLMEPDGTLVDANQTALAFINQPLSAVVGRKFWDCPWWTHSAEAVAICKEAVSRAAAGEMVRKQTTHVAADGQLAEMDFSLKPMRDDAGRITHLIPEGRDITALHVAQAKLREAHERLRAANDGLEQRVRERTIDLENALEELRRSESQFRFMANAMPQIAWTANADGTVDYCNNRFFEYSGFTAEQAMGWGWTQVVHPDDVQSSTDLWARVNAAGSKYEVEYRFRRASDGTYRWHLGRAIPMRNDDGAVIKWFGTCTDIHDQKCLNEELAEQVRLRTEQLSKATRIAEAASETKSRFLAHMSHEIRTPLTAIFGYTDMLLLKGLDPAELPGVVQIIRRNGEHLLAIINDILDISKIEAGEMSVERLPTNVAMVLGEILPLLRERANSKGITLDAHFATGIPKTFRCDPTRVRQILHNLIGNAIKFTSKGGVLVVLRLNRAADRQSLSISVKDTGAGMTPEQSSRLFAPFVQADTSHARLYGGTGLGLSISRQLARLLGGDIDLISEFGVGSVFTLTLPVEDASMGPSVWEVETADSASQASIAEAANQRFEGRVLLAEDSADNQRLISAYLRHAGASVDIVETGRAAVDSATKAWRLGRPYDLVLMDCQMPEMDGYLATQTLRNCGYDRPIVALTANAMSHERDKCLAAGSDHFLTKPLRLGVFYKVLSSYLKAPAESIIAATDRVMDQLDPIRSDLANDPIVGPLLEQFISNVKLKVDDIRRAVESSDFTRVNHLAHQVKGEAGSYGFPTVMRAAEIVEQASTSVGIPGAVAEQVRSLVEMCSRMARD